MRNYLCVLLLLLSGIANAQDQISPSQTLLGPLGIAQFSPLYQRAIDTYFTAEAAYRQQDYRAARSILQALWKDVPPGDPAWKTAQAESVALQSIASFGTPPVYAALRMLTDCVEWRLGNTQPAAPQATVQLTVVLVGKSAGREPTTREELDTQEGKVVTRTLDLALNGAAGEQLVDESYRLFDDYILAMTQGHLQVKRVYVHLPELTVQVAPHRGGVKMSREASERIWKAVPADIARSTDWWHLVYPSHVPKGAAFAGEHFVTGGMRSGPAQSRSPCFVSEDFKFLQTANQYGRRALTDSERRVVLSQWLQHEFFQYLFAAYHEQQLEVTPHQWHNRKQWPADFVGNIEVDYYEEALHKRLQTQTRRPLYIELRHAGEKVPEGLKNKQLDQD
jgi:hypothetical protein